MISAVLQHAAGNALAVAIQKNKLSSYNNFCKVVVKSFGIKGMPDQTGPISAKYIQ